LIYLERRGKVNEPAGGGFFSGADIPPQPKATASYTDSNKTESHSSSGEDFTGLLKRFGDFCLKLLNKGLNNHLEATKGEQHLFACPVIILIILVIFFFWVTVPLFVISLFFGFSYRFTGVDLGKDSVNSVMDGATNVVNDVKRTFTDDPNTPDNKG